MHILGEKFRRHLEAFASELFTYSDINKGHFSFIEKHLSSNYNYYTTN